MIGLFCGHRCPRGFVWTPRANREATMIARLETNWRRVASWLFVSSMLLGPIPTAAGGGPATSTDAVPPEEVIMRPGPLDWTVKRFFRDNPDCVNAKLDIWFWSGRYTHQLFTERSGVEHGFGMRPAAPERREPSSQQTWDGDQANPTTQQTVEA